MSSLPTKGSLRNHFREIRTNIEPTQHALWDQRLCDALWQHPRLQAAELILGFYPVSGEPDLRPLYEAALAAGKTVAFPISHKGTRTMTFCAVDALSDLVPGAYGIPEPTDPSRAVTVTETTLCLVPGLAFDRQGHRLGYGGGYYDRFLQKFPGHTLAPTYEVLRTSALPLEETDHPVKEIVTERG